MPIDTTVADTPGWWMARLSKDLEARRPRLQALMDRYEGKAPVPAGADPAAAAAYEKFRRLSRRNYAGKIARSRRDRMKLAGVRTAAANDSNGDVEADRMLRRSNMAVELGEFSTRLTVMGRCPLMVELVDSKAFVLVEDPRQVIVVMDPIVPGLVRAMLKLYHDDVNDLDVAVLHLVDGQGAGHMFRASRKRKAVTGAVRFTAGSYDWDQSTGGADGKPTGLKVIPATEAVLEGGMGVFEPHIDLLDSLDQSAFERRVISAVQAWRQRAVEIPDGADTDTDDEGQPLDWEQLLTSDPGAFWRVPMGTKFWESTVADLQPQLEQEKHEIRLVADLTSTPMRSFHSDAAGGSAEGAASQKEDLVFSVEDLCAAAEVALAGALAIGFELQADQDRADREQITVSWVDPSRRSLAERADAWSKTAEMDERERWIRVWGVTPAEYEEILAGRLQTALVGQLTDPADPTPADPAPVEDPVAA